MKQTHTFGYVLFMVLSLGVLLTACRGTAGAPNPQATIDAAVAATANAQQAIQATIAAAVEATGAAQAPPLAEEAVATPVVISQTVNVTQTTTVNTAPAAVQDYTTLSEEELVVLIEQTVAQAAAATSQYSSTTANATADDTVTAEEAQTIEVYVNTAEEAVNTAEQAMAAYYDLYYDLASETQAELEDLNQTLQEISGSVEEMNETLVEIDETLSAGLALAEDTVTNLEETAQAASDQVTQLLQQAQTWQTDYQAQVDQRVAAALNTQPTQLADTPQAALQDTFAFLQSGQQALADQQLTQAELVTIAQLGANAKASLATQNQPQLQQLSGSIATITEQLARGDISQARVSMESFNSSLGSISQLDFSPRPELDPNVRPELDRNERPADGPLADPSSRPSRPPQRP